MTSTLSRTETSSRSDNSILTERPEARSLTHRAPQLQAPPTRAHPGAILSLISLGAAAVLAMWWLNADPKLTLGDWLTEVGRKTGLLAGYAVVVLLARRFKRCCVQHAGPVWDSRRWECSGNSRPHREHGDIIRDSGRATAADLDTELRRRRPRRRLIASKPAG